MLSCFKVVRDAFSQCLGPTIIFFRFFSSNFPFQSCSSVAGFFSPLENCSTPSEKHQNVKTAKLCRATLRLFSVRSEQVGGLTHLVAATKCLASCQTPNMPWCPPTNCQIYLSKLSNVFAQIVKYICPICQIYLSKSLNVSHLTRLPT